jgi:hypothetical protein
MDVVFGRRRVGDRLAALPGQVRLVKRWSSRGDCAGRGSDGDLDLVGRPARGRGPACPADLGCGSPRTPWASHAVPGDVCDQNEKRTSHSLRICTSCTRGISNFIYNIGSVIWVRVFPDVYFPRGVSGGGTCQEGQCRLSHWAVTAIPLVTVPAGSAMLLVPKRTNLVEGGECGRLVGHVRLAFY